MSELSLDDAQARLGEILAGMQPGDEVVLTENGQPLARLVKTAQARRPCKAGSAKGKILYMAPDFDAPLDEFKEYME